MMERRHIQTVVSGIYKISKEVPVGTNELFYTKFLPEAAASMHF